MSLYDIIEMQWISDFEYGSGHGGVVILLPDFAINW